MASRDNTVSKEMSSMTSTSKRGTTSDNNTTSSIIIEPVPRNISTSSTKSKPLINLQRTKRKIKTISAKGNLKIPKIQSAEDGFRLWRETREAVSKEIVDREDAAELAAAQGTSTSEGVRRHEPVIDLAQESEDLASALFTLNKEILPTDQSDYESLQLIETGTVDLDDASKAFLANMSSLFHQYLNSSTNMMMQSSAMSSAAVANEASRNNVATILFLFEMLGNEMRENVVRAARESGEWAVQKFDNTNWIARREELNRLSKYLSENSCTSMNNKMTHLFEQLTKSYGEKLSSSLSEHISVVADVKSDLKLNIEASDKQLAVTSKMVDATGSIIDWFSRRSSSVPERTSSRIGQKRALIQQYACFEELLDTKVNSIIRGVTAVQSNLLPRVEGWTQTMAIQANDKSQQVRTITREASTTTNDDWARIADIESGKKDVAMEQDPIIDIERSLAQAGPTLLWDTLIKLLDGAYSCDPIVQHIKLDVMARISVDDMIEWGDELVAPLQSACGKARTAIKNREIAELEEKESARKQMMQLQKVKEAISMAHQQDSGTFSNRNETSITKSQAHGEKFDSSGGATTTSDEPLSSQPEEEQHTLASNTPAKMDEEDPLDAKIKKIMLSVLKSTSGEKKSNVEQAQASSSNDQRKDDYKRYDNRNKQYRGNNRGGRNDRGGRSNNNNNRGGGGRNPDARDYRDNRDNRDRDRGYNRNDNYGSRRGGDGDGEKNMSEAFAEFWQYYQKKK